MADALEALMARRPDVAYEPMLTKNDREEFAERGFIRIDRITSDEEIAWLSDVYDELFGEDTVAYIVRDVMTRLDEQRGTRQSQIIRPENCLPDLKKTHFWRNSRRLAGELLGLSGEMDGWGHMVRKAPRDTEHLPYHQDEAFWDPMFDYQSLGVWMPLDEATVESGCMKLVPGSHKLGVQPHQLGKGDPAVSYIELANQQQPAVAHPIPKGGASFHHCRTVHGSGPNMSERPRRAYINEWQAVPVPRATSKNHPWYAPRRAALDKLAPARARPAVTVPA